MGPKLMSKFLMSHGLEDDKVYVCRVCFPSSRGAVGSTLDRNESFENNMGDISKPHRYSDGT